MNYNSENDIDLMAEDESYQGGAGKEDVMESNEVDIDVSEETSKKISLIYAWGRNTDGELGTGNADTSLLPCSPRGMKGYARHISTARTHSAIINNEGHIFMTGSTLFGKIGITTNVSNFRNLRRMEEMNKHFIIKVACGDYHTLALTDKGMLYSWGGRLWDKTGHKAEGIHLIEHLKKQKVIDIACGDFHSLAVDTEGLVYSWGGGKEDKNKGQLGHCNKKDVPQPVQLQFFKDKFVTKVACGDYHTMVMTNDNEIYAFGEGIYGQLGTGGKDDTGTPRKVILNFSLALEDYFRTDQHEETHIEQLALGAHHSLFLTNRGHIYACGYNAQGQLGLGQNRVTHNIYEPTLVSSMVNKRVVMLAAGGKHSLALTSKHDVFSCGYNEKGQLGIGDEKKLGLGGKSQTSWTHVAQLSQKNISKIYAGGDHSWAIVDETEPFIRDYESPSPIKVEAPSIRNDTFSKKDDKSYAGSMDSILVQLNSRHKLELIITDVEFSHRFIHFVVKQLARGYKKRIDDYIAVVQKIEKENLRCHRVTIDTEVYDEDGQLMMQANNRGATIMLICDIGEGATEYLQIPKSNVSIGEMMVMDATQLKVGGKVPDHNKWFFKFVEMFDDCLEKVRFIELRPKQV